MNAINTCRRCGFIDKLFQENYKGEMKFVCMSKTNCDTRKNIQYIKSHSKKEIKIQLIKTPNLLKNIIELKIFDPEYMELAVRIKSSTIKWIPNPSRILQEISLNDDYKNYNLIKRESVCADLELTVFLKHPSLIKYVKDPSIVLQLALIFQNTNHVFEFRKIHDYTRKLVEDLNPKIKFFKIQEKYHKNFGTNQPYSDSRHWDFSDCVSVDTESDFSIEI